jgi:plasmid stabilization system protein ParE
MLWTISKTNFKLTLCNSVTILPLAKKDIRQAARWYNSKQNGLGKRFTQQVRQKVAFIEQYPNGANIRYDDVRTAVLEDFPFMIHYSVDVDKQLVLVVAVLHTAKNPQAWKDR